MFDDDPTTVSHLPPDLVARIPPLPADRFGEATRFARSPLTATFIVAYDPETEFGASLALTDPAPMWRVYGPISQEAWVRALKGSSADVIADRGLAPGTTRH